MRGVVAVWFLLAPTGSALCLFWLPACSADLLIALSAEIGR